MSDTKAEERHEEKVELNREGEVQHYEKSKMDDAGFGPEPKKLNNNPNVIGHW